MKKFCFLFLLALIAGIGNLRAIEMTGTFAAATFKWTDTAMTQDLYLRATGGGTYNNGSEYRITSGATITISSNYTIKSVVFTCTGSGTGTYGPSHLSVLDNNGAYTYRGNEGIWRGSTRSVSFTAATVECRATEIRITYDKPQCLAPEFSFSEGGRYRAPKTMTITSETKDALIGYTIYRNGFEPRQDHGTTPVSITFTDNDEYTVEAYAYSHNSQLAESDHKTIKFTISDQCAAPTFNLEAKTYTDVQTLVINSPTQGTVINYNIYRNGESIDSNSHADSPYTKELWQDGHYRVEAFAYDNSFTAELDASEQVALEFDIERRCEVPTFNLTDDAIYNEDQVLIISSATEDAIIEYTIEGVNTSTQKAYVTGPAKISLTQNDVYTVTAYARRDNYKNSDTNTITFTIDKKCTTPTFSLTEGRYTTAQQVTITGPEGSTITYMVNDDINEAPSPVVVELPAVEDAATTYRLSATASKDGYADSEEASAVYVIDTQYEDKTATLDVADYASKNGWKKSVQYSEATVDGLTFTAKGGANDGKYYDTNHSWRFYNGGSLTITAPAKHILNKITFTLDQGSFARADQGELDGTVWTAGEEPVLEVTFSATARTEVQKIDIEYAYDPVSDVETVAEDGVKVAAAEGGIEVVAAEAADVAVYTAAGQLVRAARVAEGSTLVNVPAGFYVVRVNNTVAKVIVK